MKDSSASIRESKLPLKEDDQLLMRGCLWMRMTNCSCRVLVVGLGLGFGNKGFFNEGGAASGAIFFLKYGFFIYFFS